MPRFQRTFDESLFYYKVGNSKTFNKFEAIKWANGDISQIHFYFLEDIWDNTDMSAEPTETWSQLMRERCLQIRDQYKTLAISYSGGYDSQTILDYCILNNVRVDELVVSTWEYFWEKSEWQQLEGKSAPLLAQWYKENKFPDLKISILPRTVDYIVQIYQRNADDMLFVDNGEIGFVKHHRAMHLNNSDIGAGILAKNDKVILDGHEKPVLVIKDGWWYMTFPDTWMQFSINSPYESFYLSRDLPKLHLKQMHMMINWLESFPTTTVAEVEELLQKTERGNLDNWFYYRWNIAVGRTMVKHWNSFDCVTSGKGAGYPKGLFDTHTVNFVKRYGDLDVVRSAIRKWAYHTRNLIDTYPLAFDKGRHKTVWTKPYAIKPVEPGRTIFSNAIL